jgi:hypothetical protein
MRDNHQDPPRILVEQASHLQPPVPTASLCRTVPALLGGLASYELRYRRLLGAAWPDVAWRATAITEPDVPWRRSTTAIVCAAPWPRVTGGFL